MKLNKTATKKQKKKKENYKRKKKHFVPFTVCLWKTSFAKLLSILNTSHQNTYIYLYVIKSIYAYKTKDSYKSLIFDQIFNHLLHSISLYHL